jgi:aspartyl-tRNA synthetase
MLKYGSDKPDLRNPIVIADVSDVFARADVEFKAFKNKTVRAIPAPGAATSRARSSTSSTIGRAARWARRGWATSFSKTTGGKLVGKGPIAKFIPAEALAEWQARRRESRRCAVLRGRRR